MQAIEKARRGRREARHNAEAQDKSQEVATLKAIEEQLESSGNDDREPEARALQQLTGEEEERFDEIERDLEFDLAQLLFLSQDQNANLVDARVIIQNLQANLRELGGISGILEARAFRVLNERLATVGTRLVRDASSGAMTITRVNQERESGPDLQRRLSRDVFRGGVLVWLRGGASPQLLINRLNIRGLNVSETEMRILQGAIDRAGLTRREFLLLDRRLQGENLYGRDRDDFARLQTRLQARLTARQIDIVDYLNAEP